MMKSRNESIFSSCEGPLHALGERTGCRNVIRDVTPRRPGEPLVEHEGLALVF